MKQAIAGVTPPEVREVTVMVVYPSIARYTSGCFLGRLYSIDAGFYIFTLGNFLALASIPHALFLYFYRLLPSLFGLPFHGNFYKLTNRRVLELRNEVNPKDSFPFLKFIFGAEVKSIELDRFDAIDIDQKPGQEWFESGDLVFKRGDIESFRLEGVSRPEAFRQTCLKSQIAYVGVKEALEREAAHA